MCDWTTRGGRGGGASSAEYLYVGGPRRSGDAKRTGLYISYIAEHYVAEYVVRDRGVSRYSTVYCTRLYCAQPKPGGWAGLCTLS